MMVVAAIGDEIARPFAFSACQRYELSYDPDSGDGLFCGPVSSAARFGLR